MAAADIIIHTVESEYQTGKHDIRVLLPHHYDTARKHRVLYVLPVEPEFQQKYGNPLQIFQEINSNNQYDLILVQMGFEKVPWFGDNAADPRTRQASYLKKFVVPFVEKNHSTLGTAQGRLLIGFSKSGWGAFSLILHDPDFYGYAAAWDAPILFQNFHFGMEAVYGTPEQLAIYRPDRLIPRQKKFFQPRPRLVLTGEKDWGKTLPAPDGGSHTVETHELLKREGIPHFYDGALACEHRWDRIWMQPTLKALVELANLPAKK